MLKNRKIVIENIQEIIVLIGFFKIFGVEGEHPVKQGLKHRICGDDNTPRYCVEGEHPVKQGLKPNSYTFKKGSPSS